MDARNRFSLLIITVCCALLMIVFLAPQECGAVRWEYPSGSTLGNCLASKGIYKLFPDRETAYAQWQRDIALANEARAANPSLPKPYPWQWGCFCPYWCNCTSQWSCPVCDCGFSCVNCANPEPDPSGATHYWYPRSDCPNNCYYTYSPPGQVFDPPITTEATDKNAGGGCAGKCDTLAGDRPDAGTGNMGGFWGGP